MARSKRSRSIEVANRYPLVCEGSLLGDDFGRDCWDHRNDIRGTLWEIDYVTGPGNAAMLDLLFARDRPPRDDVQLRRVSAVRQFSG